MRSFLQHITEASASNDYLYRSKASGAWEAFANKVESEFKEGKPMPFGMTVQPQRVFVGDLGKFIGNPEFSGLEFIITQAQHDSMASAVFDYTSPKIVIYAVDQTLNWGEFAGYFLPKKRKELKRSAVHELIHFLDFKRMGERAWSDAQEKASNPNSNQEYFNHPLELNSHMQQGLSAIDDALAHTSSYEIDKLTASFDAFWDFAWFHISTPFQANLTPQNQKKLRQRLYKYWEDLKKNHGQR